MSSTNVSEYLGVGIYAVYERGRTVVTGVGSVEDYLIYEVARYLTAIQEAWDSCVAIATYRQFQNPRAREVEQISVRAEIDSERATIAEMQERRPVRAWQAHIPRRT